MIPKYLMFAVGLVAATATIAGAAMELAVLSQMQQEADARGCRNSIAANASLGRCVKPDLQADESDESDESR